MLEKCHGPDMDVVGTYEGCVNELEIYVGVEDKSVKVFIDCDDPLCMYKEKWQEPLLQNKVKTELPRNVRDDLYEEEN